MKFRLRFLWPDPRAAAEQKFLGLGLITRLVSAEGDLLTVWVNTRTLLKLAAALLILAWLGGAAGLHAWLQRNPYNRVSFADLALPTHWSRLRDLRGQSYLAEAEAQLAAGRIGPAVAAFRAGLSRHPDAPGPRLALARIYAGAHDYPDLRALLLPGPGAPPATREALALLLTSAAQNDDLPTMIEACDLALTDRTLPTADRAWLRLQKAGALVGLRRFPEALATLGDPAGLVGADERRLAVLALCETGEPDRAISLLRAWPLPADSRPWQLRLLALALRQAGRTDEMHSALQALIAADPAALEPRLAALEEYQHAGWRDAATRALQDAIDRFGTDSNAMSRLIQLGADLHEPDLLRLCLEDLEERGQPAATVRAHLFFALLTHGDLAAAGRTLAAPPAANVDDRLDPPSANLLRALLGCLTADSPDAIVSLRTALAASHFNLRSYLDAADILSRHHRGLATLEVATAGLGVFPSSRRLASLRSAAQEKISAARVDSRLAAVSQPVATTSFQVGAIGSFLDELERTMNRQDWERATALITAVRSASPSWLPQLEADLTWRDARIAFEKGNVDRVVFFLGERVRVRPREASRALGFVREYRARGDLESARRLLARLVREAPDFAPAQSLSAELNPRPAPTPAAGSSGS